MNLRLNGVVPHTRPNVMETPEQKPSLQLHIIGVACPPGSYLSHPCICGSHPGAGALLYETFLWRLCLQQPVPFRQQLAALLNINPGVAQKILGITRGRLVAPGPLRRTPENRGLGSCQDVPFGMPNRGQRAKHTLHLTQKKAY